MTTTEHKYLPLELKDMSREKRTAIIAHAVYNSIDRVGDISTKGMFNKSWQENKNIDFLFNHDDSAIVGKVLRTFEDEEKAYTEVKFGQWKLGDDVMEMADSGVLRGASFGYVTEKKEYIEVKGRKVRRLKEVKHSETSLLTKMPAHPDAGIVVLNKSEDIQLLKEFKGHVERIEAFCRNSKASDDTIKLLLTEIEEAKSIMSIYDTVATQPITEPPASVKKFSDALHLLKLKI